MRDQLIHRGPDSAGLWVAGRFGFGQRRLAIVDPYPQSDQPMVSSDRRFVLNYNGEIYNYLELRAELEAHGRVFVTKSDTEVLLQALIHWGESALPRLNGMFAFSLWDNHKREMLIARDRFGEKPLFYFACPRYGFACASEMKALFADARIPQQIDEDSLDNYQSGAYFEEAEPTLFKDVKRLEAAHLAVINEYGSVVRKARYWTPDYAYIDDQANIEDAVFHFGDLLRESVRKRLRSDVPVGSSLSGGMDSSAIVGQIANLRAAGLGHATQKVFSARFGDDPTLDEGSYIDKVVRHTGVTPHGVTPDPLDLMEEIDALHWHQEEPFLSASIYLQWCVARLAYKNEVTVLLDGQGADELLGGYQFYYRHYQQDMLDRGERFAALFATLRFNARLARTALFYKQSKRRFDDRVAMSSAEVVSRMWKNEPVYDGAYSHGIPPSVKGSRVRKIMAEALQYNCLPQLLRYADRNAMAFSRESRMPYLDHDLVDFTLTLPDKILFRNAWQKYPLRKSMGGYVPKSVRWRADKVGYAAPLDIWIRGPMKEWAYENLFSRAVADQRAFDWDQMKALWDRHQRGENHSWVFWRWISLSLWIRMVDGRRLRSRI